MSLFNTLRRALGVNSGDNLEDETQISSFDQAGLTGDETTGTTPQATAQTGALPQNVVDNTQAQTDITTGTGTGTGTTGTTGGGTPAPKLATPGIVGGQTGTGTAGGSTFSPQFIQGGGSPNVNVLGNQLVTVVDEKGQKKQVLQDLIEIGGTGFDDEVLARKLRRQAAMPELKNEDYYPNQPFTQAQTAWGDPIFSGAGALFPMAAYDAQRRARAQAEIDEAKRDVMQIKIPEIKTGAYVETFRNDFTNEITSVVDEAVKQSGGNRALAMKRLRQSGKLAEIQNKYEGVARSIDQNADRAKEFLKNAQEKSTTMYFSPEGVRAATNFLNGMGAYADKRISAEQLNQLEEQFNTAERWTLYKDRALSKFKPNDYIPTQQQLENPSAEDMAGFQAAEQEALRLKGAKPDFKKWIFAKKYSEAALPQVMSSIVEPFFSENSTAAEQLVNPGESIDDAKSRVAQSIVDLLGRQIEVGEATQTAGGNTSVTINTGGVTQEKPYYENINAKRDEIIGGTKDAIDKINQAKQTGQQRVGALQGAFKNIFRAISDQGEVTTGYIGFEPVNVKPYNFKVQPSLLGEYMVFDENTKSFRKSKASDYDSLNEDGSTTRMSEGDFKTRSAGGSLTKQEVVLMTPNGKLVPWDATEIPANSQLFVLQQFTIDYAPKGTDGLATIPAKSKTVYSVGPITQNFKVADDVFQARTLQEATKGGGKPFNFNK